MKKKSTLSSPRPHPYKDQAGTAIYPLAILDDGFFGSLAHRAAAHRPPNENMIRGMS